MQERDELESVLEEAQRIIGPTGERHQSYNQGGGKLENFSDIARLWSVVLGREVTPFQVCLCMVQVKVARLRKGYHRDSVVDVAGYAGCAEAVVAEQEALARASEKPADLALEVPQVLGRVILEDVEGPLGRHRVDEGDPLCPIVADHGAHLVVQDASRWQCPGTSPEGQLPVRMNRVG